MTPFTLFLLTTSLVLSRAAPAVDVLPRSIPAKITLQKHVLADGAKPRNRGRLYKGEYAGRNVARGIASGTEGLQDYYNGTDLQWYGAFQAGTPPQNFTVVFDTGSWSTEIPSTDCTTCGDHHKFNSSASSTYSTHNTTHIVESFVTGVGVDPSDYEYYILSWIRDTVTIAGVPVGESDFYFITEESSGFMNAPFDGLVGMGPYGDTVFQNLINNGLPALFSLALLPNGTDGSEITLGGIDTTKFTEPLTYIPINQFLRFWELNSTQFAVNGKTTSDLTVPVMVIFDSGTSNVVMPPDVADAMYALISPDIKPFGTLGAYGIACSAIGSINATLDFTFISTTGAEFNLTIPPEELNVGPFASDPTTCQTLINAQDGYYILGGSVLKHYYSVWDQGNARMGFSPTSS